MRTYQTMYQNETRALEITINQQDGEEFVPSGASASIYDADDVVIINNQPAMVEDNKVRIIVGPTTTGFVGEYRVLWTIVRGPYTYHHVTDLDIVEP